MCKRVLLIGGGGTLGTYTAKELLEKGHFVDIICLEDKTSTNEKLKYFKASADLDYLTEFLKDNFSGIKSVKNFTLATKSGWSKIL